MTQMPQYGSARALMAASMELEAWATQRLEALGVDGVFAPYVIGMLNGSDDDDEIRGSVHDVLMGWLSPEDEEKALEFVNALLAYYRDPTLLDEELRKMEATGQAATAAVTAVLDDDDDDNGALVDPTGLKPIDVDGHRNDSSSSLTFGELNLSGDLELKASAPLFIPGGVAPFTDADTLGDTGAGASSSEKRSKNDEADDDVMENEDAFFWSVAYDLVGHLQLKFPEVDPTRLCELLKLVELDADKAHAVLKATLEREATGTTQVCRHYLAGDCRRADCMFIHDTDAITCRFWLRGMCLQGENCVFAHELVEVYALDQSGAIGRDYDSEDEDSGDTPPIDFQAEEMFPSLGSSAAAANDASNLAMNFARAVSVKPSPWSSFASSAESQRLSQPPPPPLMRRALHHKTADAVAGRRWLSTGSAVEAQYAQLREEAYELACARNKCFMNATRAYRSGNKSLARSLSQQGHEYNDKMKQCHYDAASRIFEMRNPRQQLYEDHLMDLHGLHVAEAVELLDHMLPSLSEDGVEAIYVVTGSGHHSKGPTGNARLRPAVERFLATEGYQFSPVADRQGFVGMLLVDLRW
ncbi:hypothetical protein P43SY_002619 [Pythium insidiosum]|uniref:Smr domain-containing protein n=1 Tax=Pythium insidiosum TaxID=114742 RepID=A0AAD5LUE1_PYTIN|nr:hypothetical protein P43SY_002619 [Pythium insidiosum]KAJ0412750.1 hypothetical protein ATCC90586_002380 [Pythium insidiosum]